MSTTELSDVTEDPDDSELRGVDALPSNNLTSAHHFYRFERNHYVFSAKHKHTPVLRLLCVVRGNDHTRLRHKKSQSRSKQNTDSWARHTRCPTSGPRHVILAHAGVKGNGVSCHTCDALIPAVTVPSSETISRKVHGHFGALFVRHGPLFIAQPSSFPYNASSSFLSLQRLTEPAYCRSIAFPFPICHKCSLRHVFSTRNRSHLYPLYTCDPHGVHPHPRDKFTSLTECYHSGPCIPSMTVACASILNTP